MSPRSSAKRAFSLAEVLVVGSLTLLVMCVLLDLFVPSLRAFSRTSVRASQHQMAGLALSRVQADLECSGPGLVTVQAIPSGLAIALVQSQEVLGDGTAVWSADAVVYVWDRGSGRLSRRLVTPSPALSTSNPRALSSSQLLAAVASPAREERALAGDVQDFRVGHTSRTAPVTSQPFRQPIFITLTVSQSATHQSSPEVYTETRAVYLHN